MKYKNLKISKLIYIWLGVIFLITAILVASALASVASLWNNTVELYEHPLTVRRAVGEVNVSVLTIHKNMLQLVLQENQLEADEFIRDIDAVEADVYRQLDVFYDRYLGPKSDIDALADAIAQWKTIRNETIQLYRTGLVEEAIQRVEAHGIGGMHAEKVMSLVAVISNFAYKKSEEFYQSSMEQRNMSAKQLTILSVSVFVMLVLISYMIRKGIIPPLVNLTSATEAMQQGKFDTRIQYESTNELGALSKAFNVMASSIETEMEFRDCVTYISKTMLVQDSLRPFCQELLMNLMLKTDSQMGAIYFLDESKNGFVPYESIGAKNDNLSTFSLTSREGEFGKALSTKSVQHITDIPSDIQIVFSTVSGEYTPKEIITIPILKGLEVIAVISIASIKSYSPFSIRLISGLLNEITARLNVLLASKKILEFSQKLQNTNIELLQQTKELETQSEELTEQNIELEMQKEQLDEASKLKTNFLSNMSHELRTPLNSVIALSELLSRKLANQIPDEEYSYLEIIERNGKNLLTLINDVLDISRIEAGRVEFDISRFNASSVIDDIISMIQPQAQQKNIELLHEPEDTLIISSDVDKFRHILQNLVANAVKFTETGKVTVTSQKSLNNIIVKVIDTGIGIAAEHIPYIFDEFRQADGSTSRKFGGAGLGLAISKKYANLLGGTVSVKSTPNQGSEFTLSLPLLHSAENGVKEKEDYAVHVDEIKLSQTHIDLSNKTILLVDDNETAIIQVRDLVEETGCRVKVAHGAGEAFKIIDQSIPDAIILDLMMPDIDGFRVLEKIRNAEPTAHIPVLILTSKFITKEELKFLKRNNIHQLIQKGDVKRLELQNAVSNMLLPANMDSKDLPSKSQIIEGKPVVLVVEDNPDNMITVKALLQDHHTVLEAVNAYECIEMTKIHLPNLILMDIALPDLSGIEAFKQIRKMTELHNIPVVALTASAMTHNREAILAYGFDAFIAKPIIAKEFFKVIQEVLYGKTC